MIRLPTVASAIDNQQHPMETSSEFQRVNESNSAAAADGLNTASASPSCTRRWRGTSSGSVIPFSSCLALSVAVVLVILATMPQAANSLPASRLRQREVADEDFVRELFGNGDRFGKQIRRLQSAHSRLRPSRHYRTRPEEEEQKEEEEKHR
jgi:hypothetical protein